MRPDRIAVAEAQLVDLRDRLARTRWPEAATADGWTQGVPLEYARELTRYWANSYDWRRVEAELNALPQWRTELDGEGEDAVDIHFFHVRSRHAGARPLLLANGWPSSVVEYLDVIDALVDPPDPADAFHLVIPSMPGYGFSGKPAVSGWGVERIARAWAQLMDQLGYERYFAHGSDWGSFVTSALGTDEPQRLAGLHLTLPVAPAPPAGDGEPLTDAEQRVLAAGRAFAETGTGYSAQQSTRPQTLGYALADSPAGQCLWIVEKFREWSDCDGHPENAISRDRLLDNVTYYWLSASAASSSRLYWESFRRQRLDEVPVPTGVSQYPHEPARMPRSWIERRYSDLRWWREPESGGHFPAIEQPERFVEELTAFFRTLR
ncbi:Epoxide hydrolase domain protein [Kribbella flavida DSM 17836]|uniref:Epoxide hydrolase domain protein n=1 Tax=Kribbella flavida (strain DSM 17836 / JCM 10339 / NBRC 14399) TaxID=479435 RepID=D2PL25_KRIFD|nr:epoxide hydrolase family protein [Kribbella flavida]ADB34280.1 Epoxide hydrolase domain protein [Kribbella flavida DSM 17836]